MTKGELYNQIYVKFQEETGKRPNKANAEYQRFLREELKKEFYSEENQAKIKQLEKINEVRLEDKFVQKQINMIEAEIKQCLRVFVIYYSDAKIDEISKYMYEINNVPESFIKNIIFKKKNGKKKIIHGLQPQLSEVRKNIVDEFTKRNSGLTYYITEDGSMVGYKYNPKELMKEIENEVLKRFTSEVIKEELLKSNIYGEELKIAETQKIILEEIPENFIDLYPNARSMKRKWVLHIGPTNSGKTYESIEKLKSVANGLYLAPLRLLALEVQEKMIDAGVLCNLTTGEEEDIIEGATHCSATVEKLNLDRYYDLCVIDECQMIEDWSRGWAWTKAILGVYAGEVHVCMSENARNIVCRLIEECGEEYEIIEHTRNTDLIFEKQGFNFPKSVRKNDALVVFSRKNVLAVATELEEKGHHVSILYGNLPYKVRKEELRKFREGDTDIVVTTDCIGMGMNVNVERVVFLSSSKFDGFEQRYLRGPEVKQIAGRAGRMGMYDVGYVNAMEDRDWIEEKLKEEYDDINFVRIGFPETLINIDDSLSNILISWSKMANKDIFIKTDITRDLGLCRYLEQFDFSKEQMLKFINIPFDEKNQVLLGMWQDLIMRYRLGELDLEKKMKNIGLSKKLDILELDYKKMDLIFSFLKAIGEVDGEIFEKVAEKKDIISEKLIEELKKRKNIHKNCTRCGKTLKWNYPFNMCQKCFEEQRYRRHNYDFYLY